MVKKEKKVYKWYLITSIIFSTFYILDFIIDKFISIERFPSQTQLIINFLSTHYKIMNLIYIFWLLFNIVIFVIFLVKKIEKVALILPGIYIFYKIIEFIAGFLWVVWVMPIAFLLRYILPFVILAISIKLLLRK